MKPSEAMLLMQDNVTYPPAPDLNVYWVTNLGDQMVTNLGDPLVFKRSPVLETVYWGTNDGALLTTNTGDNLVFFP